MNVFFYVCLSVQLPVCSSLRICPSAYQLKLFLVLPPNTFSFLSSVPTSLPPLHVLVCFCLSVFISLCLSIWVYVSFIFLSVYVCVGVIFFFSFHVTLLGLCSSMCHSFCLCLCFFLLYVFCLCFCWCICLSFLHFWAYVRQSLSSVFFRTLFFCLCFYRCLSICMSFVVLKLVMSIFKFVFVCCSMYRRSSSWRCVVSVFLYVILSFFLLPSTFSASDFCLIQFLAPK
jgi:hypothetical protein